MSKQYLSTIIISFIIIIYVVISLFTSNNSNDKLSNNPVEENKNKTTVVDQENKEQEKKPDDIKQDNIKQDNIKQDDIKPKEESKEEPKGQEKQEVLQEKSSEDIIIEDKHDDLTLLNENLIEAYFLNSMTHPSFKSALTANDAFIFKTKSNKYILLDTGIGTDEREIVELIYSKLKELQNSDIVVIDYMIISHMHSDHGGNAAAILLDNRFDIKNFIFKREKVQKLTNTIYNAAVKNGKANIIEVNKDLQEGHLYSLDDNVNMYLFNLSDVFSNIEGCKSISYINYLSRNYNDNNLLRDGAFEEKNNYIYLNGEDYVNNEESFNLISTSESKYTVNKKNYLLNRFYAVYLTGGYNCNSNANSIVLVFQVKTKEGNKYLYIPSDLENNGYDPLGEYDENLKTTIHGGFSSYPINTKTINNINYGYLNGNRLVVNESEKKFPVASEYIIAKEVVDKFSDIKGNITVYQESHHGLNNSSEAVSLLGVNSNKTYSVTPAKYNPQTSDQFRIIRAQYYLRDSNIMYTGAKGNNGIKCSINGLGNTLCAKY